MKIPKNQKTVLNAIRKKQRYLRSKNIHRPLYGVGEIKDMGVDMTIGQLWLQVDRLEKRGLIQTRLAIDCTEIYLA